MVHNTPLLSFAVEDGETTFTAWVKVMRGKVDEADAAMIWAVDAALHGIAPGLFKPGAEIMHQFITLAFPPAQNLWPREFAHSVVLARDAKAFHDPNAGMTRVSWKTVEGMEICFRAYESPHFEQNPLLVQIKGAGETFEAAEERVKPFFKTLKENGVTPSFFWEWFSNKSYGGEDE